MSERQTVSVERAVVVSGVSRRTLYYWMLANKVEWLRTYGGSRRIFVDTLQRAAEKKNQHAKPPEKM